ncbi:uncharacterized protein LOC133655070 [Entelurus aequoreus]|uniref:uncharacterized protein LOC133655070 n=1 Tax=Entelurus aequoreus TaxID=161455 RepID=UPI002B1E2605|nr:uncharacterized protein LOC133655070 [Entelurus aequoreus]
MHHILIGSMEVGWWICALGLLSIPAGVNTWPVSQNPSRTSVVTVNSFSEITCSTRLPDPVGVLLGRHFRSQRDVLYLSLERGRIAKNTTAAEFEGRIHITPFSHPEQGHGFTIKLSLLQKDDSDMYICQWTFLKSNTWTAKTILSNHSIIAVRDVEQCHKALNTILIAMNVMLLTVTMAVGVVIVRHRYKFKGHFQPWGRSKPTRKFRIQHVCNHERGHNYPHFESAYLHC